MEYMRLGTTDLEVSRICFGTLWTGGVDTEDAISAIQKALELGCNFIDTAEAYGKGHSEEVVRRAVSGRRDKVIIATKGGLDWGQFNIQSVRPTEHHIGMTGEMSSSVYRNSNPLYLEAAIDGSLKRLNTDYIDIYQIHYPDSATPWDATIGALRKAQSAGKIRYFGVCNFNVQQMSEWLRVGPVCSLQCLYNMLERGSEADLLPFCRETSIPLLAYGSLAHGLLTGKYSQNTCVSIDDPRAQTRVFRGENYHRNLAMIEKLKTFASEKEITLSQLAIAWVLAQPGVTSALAAAKTRAQVEENLVASSIRLLREELTQIGNFLQR